MRLLIVSHTPHYLRESATVGWGPTVREIDHLSTLFEEIVHVAPLHQEPAPESALAYRSRTVKVRVVAPAGGDGLARKLGLLMKAPGYAWTVWRELGQTDAVHVRCPANISLIALLLLCLRRRPKVRWVKYAGNWQPRRDQPLSYRFQRWLLRRGLARARVTVNGKWEGQPRHVWSFLNPCLTEPELAEGRLAAGSKTLSQPLRLLYVGALQANKGARVVLDVASTLTLKGIDVAVDFVGDGPERPLLEALAASLGIATLTRFHGWLPRAELASFYAGAHFLLLPSNSEGWPKVISEGMAYGVVPLSTTVSSIPQHLAAFGTGKTLPPGDAKGFAIAIEQYCAAPQTWEEESRNAVEAAQLFSYPKYLRSVSQLLGLKGSSHTEALRCQPAN